MTAKLVTLITAVAIGGAAPPASGVGPSQPRSASAAKKHKAIKCRNGRVAIKANRRTVGCRRLRAALPAPRAGDSRLLVAESALDDDLRGLRDRRGRRAPSLKRLVRKVGPRPPKPPAHRPGRPPSHGPVARDERDGSAAAAEVRRRHADHLRALQLAPGRRQADRDDDARQRRNLDLSLAGGGYRIDLRLTSDQCDHFDAPTCPTVAGLLEATDSSTNRMSLEIAKRDTVLMSRSFAYSGRTRMRAEVAPNAELDWIDVDDTQTANIEMGGTEQHFGPIHLVYTGIHHAHVNMPQGRIAPDLSAVDISFTTRGVTAGRSELGKAGNSIANDLDAQFATLVAAEIVNFQRREAGWKDPGTGCIEVSFNPASRTLKLRRRQHGELSGQGVAAQGGGAVNGTWTLTQPANATFQPAQVSGVEPHFSYDVTRAGRERHRERHRPGHLEGRSRGGELAAGDGRQGALPRDDQGDPRPDLPGGRLRRGLGTDIHRATCRPRGGDQPFEILEAGGGGPEGGGAAGYDEVGRGTYTLAPCDGHPGCSNDLFLPAGIPSHGSTLFSADGDRVAVVADALFDGGDCQFNSVTLGTGEFPRSTIGADTITVPLSFNSGSTHGNSTVTLTRVDE